MLTLIRVRSIVPVGTGNLQAIRDDLAAGAASANQYYSQAGIQFVVDNSVTVDPDLLDNCTQTNTAQVGSRYVGVVPVTQCGGGNYSDFVNVLSLNAFNGGWFMHEGGHFMGLSHVHPGSPSAFDQSFAAIAQPVLAPLAPSQRQAAWDSLIASTFDGDGLSDTGPTSELGIDPSVLEPGSGQCEPQFTGKINVVFSGSGSPCTAPDCFEGRFSPDRTAITSYYGYCNGTVAGQYTITPMQSAIMQNAINNGVQRRLMGPGLRWANWSQVAGGTSQGLGSAAFDGLLYLFAAGGTQDHDVYNNVALPGQPFSGWSGLGGATAAPIAATPFDGHIYMFARADGQDTRIYVNVALPGQSWSGWSGLGADTDIALGATAFDNRLYVFAKGIDDNGIYVSIAEPQQPFSGWQPIGGQTDTPIAATTFDNKLYAITRGLGSNQYYVNVAPPQQAFGGWGAIPSELASGVVPTGAMAITSYGGRLFAVARGTNNLLYFNSALPQQAFGQWLEVPGGMTTDAAPTVTVFDGRLYLTVKGTDNSIQVVSAESLAP